MHLSIILDQFNIHIMMDLYVLIIMFWRKNKFPYNHPLYNQDILLQHRIKMKKINCKELIKTNMHLETCFKNVYHSTHFINPPKI
jgi:hypothetical protein